MAKLERLRLMERRQHLGRFSARNRSLVCINAQPSTFVPLHRAGTEISSLVLRPMPQIRSLRVASARIWKPVASKCSLNGGSFENF